MIDFSKSPRDRATKISEENKLNSGFWISWYNLPAQGRDDYLAWLHGSYIPAVLKRPGVLGAAHYASESNVRISGAAGRLRATSDPKVPTGDRFILIFGGKTPYAFANPAPSIYHAGLSATDRKMLAMRKAGRPLWRVPKNSPGPRSFRSISAM